MGGSSQYAINTLRVLARGGGGGGGGGDGEHEAQAQILDMLQTLPRSAIDTITVHWVEEGMCNSWEPILWLYTDKVYSYTYSRSLTHATASRPSCFSCFLHHISLRTKP